MKLAIFGGTFDPPHCGHLMIAEKAVAACGLDRVIFVPCRQSPHKDDRPGASDAQRLEMLRLATANLPWAEVSDWELQRQGLSYSWQTASHFAESCPKAQLFWIMGADQWLALHRWAHPEILARLLTFVVFPRGDLQLRPDPNFRAVFLSDRMDVSATEIRQRLRRGLPPGEVMPAEVRLFVEKAGLYR